MRVVLSRYEISGLQLGGGGGERDSECETKSDGGGNGSKRERTSVCLCVCVCVKEKRRGGTTFHYKDLLFLALSPWRPTVKLGFLLVL